MSPLSRTPSLGMRAVHLIALSAFGIAQPLFQILSGGPGYFALEGFTGIDVVVYTIAVVLIVPAFLIAIEITLGLVSARAAAVSHQVFVTGLSILVAGRVLRAVGFPPTMLVGAALVVGVLIATLYSGWEPARTFFTMCAFASVAFVAFFLAKMPLSALSATEARAGSMSAVQARTPVVVVIFDEFSGNSLVGQNGMIDAARFPNFGALAGTATWYRNATTVYDATDFAVPAILTGRLPRRDQLPVLADHPYNLFTLLGRSYSVHAFQAETRLCPRSVCPNALPSLGARMWRVVTDVNAAVHYRLPYHLGRWSDPQKEVADFLASIHRDGNRQLYVMHVLLPHVPWRYLPSGRTYAGGETLAGWHGWDVWTGDPQVVEQGYRRYMLQVAYTDRVLGEVVRRLKSMGLWNRSLVVVTADHGVSFRPGDHRRMVDSTNFADIAAVPLFVKRPWQRTGRADDRTARSVDILPSIADVLGIHVRWKLDGRSLFRPNRPFPSTIAVGDSGRVKLSWRQFRAERAAAVAEKTRLFGSGADPLYADGSHRALIGIAVDALPQVAAVKLRGTLDQPSSTTFDPSSGFAPSRISGRVEGLSGAGGTELAIGVNGRIATVTRSLRSGNVAWFSTFVPDSSFRAGRNVVSLFAIRTGPGGVTQLARLASRGS